MFAFIQARMGSSRFPGKVLHKFNQKETILDFQVRRLNKSKISKLVILTSNNYLDDKIVNHCNKMGYDVFRGDEKDVLSRFINAAEFYNQESFLRICSDNPMISTYLIDELVDNYNESDYLSHSVNNVPGIKTHYGLFSELVKLSTLKKLDKIIDVKSEHREHVTSGLYTNDVFQCNFIDFKVYNTPLRLTIDDKIDLDNIQKLEKIIKEDFGTDFKNNIKLIPNSIMINMKNQIIKYEK